MAPLCHTSTSRHQNSSNAADTNQQEECANTSKVGRGKTAGLSIAKKKRKSAIGKLSVFIPSDKMVAVGPGAADFVTEISIIVQKKAPLNVEKWKDVSDYAKDKIVEKVMAKVQEIFSGMLQDMTEEANKDPIINAAFQSIVGERSGYCRGFGAGIKPSKGKFTTGLHQELKNEREKRQDIELKLKEVESQLIEERNMREEMTLRFEESQRQLEEKMERQVEEHLSGNYISKKIWFLGCTIFKSNECEI